MTLVEAARAAFGSTPWKTADLLALPDKSWHATVPVALQYALAHNADGGVRALGRYLNSGMADVWLAGKHRQGFALWKVDGPLIPRQDDDSDLFS